jgi:hypothetical protein
MPDAPSWAAKFAKNSSIRLPDLYTTAATSTGSGLSDAMGFPAVAEEALPRPPTRAVSRGFLTARDQRFHSDEA